MVTGIATIAAAYFGAKYAFEKNAEKECENVRNQNRVNGNIALFNLTRMFEILEAFQSQFINPKRNDKYPFLSIRDTLPRETMKLNLEILYFLLETDVPNLLGETAITEEWYVEAIKHINERSRIHREEYQPLLEILQKVRSYKGPLDENQIKENVGAYIFDRLKVATELMIKDVDDAIPRIINNAEQLSKCLKMQFPEGNFINPQFPVGNEI